MSVITRENAEHYQWGDNADGWHLLKSESLSVIEEQLPAGGREVRHYHQRAQQFFYVLSGGIRIELEGDVHDVVQGSGLHVPAGKGHQVVNHTGQSAVFLVISQPKSHGDRVEA